MPTTTPTSTPTASPTPTQQPETRCSDRFDNDGDGVTDCADDDCDGVGSCEFATELTCNDVFDNDADGGTDCGDADCSGASICEYPETTCDDGFDNDADGATDCADVDDCGGVSICEYPESSCDDAFDNDGDGATDCADADCDGLGSCEFGAELTCTDAFDNDGDGNVDCKDSDCGFAAKCVLFTGQLSLRQGSLYYPIAYGGTLNGSGVAAIGGPYAYSVRVPQSAFVGKTTGNLTSPPPPYLYFGSQASFANESGSFGTSGGVGTLTATVFDTPTPAPLGYVGVIPTGKQFGGTLRLLGTLRRQTTHSTTTSSVSVMASQGLPLENVGLGQFTTYVTSNGTYTFFTSNGTNTNILGTTMTTARAWGARWTTGSISVWTPNGSPVTTRGYDYRISSGRYGTLRLVTPRLVATGVPARTVKPGFAVLELRFAPEPVAGIALAVGLLGLGLLWKFHRRSAPRR